MRNAFLIIALLCVGFLALGKGTDGYTVLTSEGSRRTAVAKHPVVIPPILLRDRGGSFFKINDYREGLTLVEFIYTGCQTTCVELGNAFEEISDSLSKSMKVRLVSISIDPTDQLEDLQRYAERFNIPSHLWKVAKVKNRKDTTSLLNTFGIIAIPDGYGGYEHNAAIHIVDRSGKLISIVDHEVALLALIAMQGDQ
jgi:protein SCO1/2